MLAAAPRPGDPALSAASLIAFLTREGIVLSELQGEGVDVRDVADDYRRAILGGRAARGGAGARP